MNTREVLESARKHLASLAGHVFDILTIAPPTSPDAAVNLAKIVSKLSPFLGNLIEFNTVEFLNAQSEFKGLGTWKRQDPGFPDAIFSGSVSPAPGLEIKAWFPLATEITARFRDSQSYFVEDCTDVCLLAWIPNQLISGTPYILDVCIVPGRSLAKARDTHYHNPPDYLVLEPEDTRQRTRNLQQTNTTGHKWQGTRKQFRQAEKIVATWGADGRKYRPSAEYQARLRQLLARFKYRLDTNFSKMDRVVHPGIEEFKDRILKSTVHGTTIRDWARLLYKGRDSDIRAVLKERFGIKSGN